MLYVNLLIQDLTNASSQQSDVDAAHPNIIELQRLFAQTYQHDSYFDDNARNRSLLLSKQVADLLTPDVLFYLFVDPSGRNTRFNASSASLSQIISQGFLQGDDTSILGLLTNSDTDTVESNQENHDQNTTRICKNLSLTHAKLNDIPEGRSHSSSAEPSSNARISLAEAAVQLRGLTELECSMHDVFHYYKLRFEVLLRSNGRGEQAQDFERRVQNNELNDCTPEKLLRIYKIDSDQLLFFPLTPQIPVVDNENLVPFEGMPSPETTRQLARNYSIIPLNQDFLFVAVELDQAIFPLNPTSHAAMLSSYHPQFSFLAIDAKTENPLGYLIAEPRTNDVMHISFMGVTEQRRGIGTALFEKLLTTIAQKSIDLIRQITLDRERRNYPALFPTIRFYEKLGFNESSHKGSGIIMKKTLAVFPPVKTSERNQQTFFSASDDDGDDPGKRLVKLILPPGCEEIIHFVNNMIFDSLANPETKYIDPQSNFQRYLENIEFVTDELKQVMIPAFTYAKTVMDKTKAAGNNNLGELTEKFSDAFIKKIQSRCRKLDPPSQEQVFAARK